LISLEDIKAARSAILPYVERTPLVRSRALSALSGAEVFLKCENLQRTGSFKVRGAFNKLLALKAENVVAASMGNHAQGVACAASSLGVRAKVVMPVGASIAKELAVRAYGGEVVLHGRSLKEAMEFARSQEGYTFVHTFDDDHLIAGQGTVGLEVVEQAEGGVDFVFVPVGGGSLVGGVAMAVKSLLPDTEVIGVQAEAATSALSSFMAKSIVEKTPGHTLADGIAVGRVGERNLEVILKYVDYMASVDEGSIARAILLLMERKRLVVEGAGAVPLAHLLSEKERYRGKRVVLVISGGNIDVTLLDRVIAKGLSESGRIASFGVVLDDVPGTLAGASGVIAGLRGNILGVSHDRLSGRLPVGKALVRFTVETRGAGHLGEVLSGLKAAGFDAQESP
jgi:threonine dehydratase